MELNNYETVFILNPVLSDAQMKDTVEKFKKLLTGQKAELVNEESWGIKPLAYPIGNKKTGYYTYFEYKAPASLIKVLEVEFVRDENVLRFLTTALEKYAVEYNEKRRKGAFDKSKNTVTA
ncbi:MAG: 30S ribosomal protein S6 [Cytophagales bacterium]|nr:30S ribosomal protein S6 [Cytophagales bacterium]